MTTNHTPLYDQLTQRAKQIATATLDAVQAADEIGGCETSAEYVALMDCLIVEFTHRKSVSIAAREAEGNPEDERVLLELSEYGGAVLYWQLNAHDSALYADAAARGVIRFNPPDDCYVHLDAVAIDGGGYEMKEQA